MTLNDIKDYRRNMEINKPDDVIQITTDRATADWMATDLKKGKKRLNQAVNDPNTKARKREKKELELHRLKTALNAIATAQMI